MYHILITEDKEIKLDVETDGILAAIDMGDEVKGVTAINKLTAEDVVNLISTLDNIKDSLFKDSPSIKLLDLLRKSEKKSDAKPDDGRHMLDRAVELLTEALENKN